VGRHSLDRFRFIRIPVQDQHGRDFQPAKGARSLVDLGQKPIRGIGRRLFDGRVCGVQRHVGDDAEKAAARLAAGGGDSAFLQAKLVTARFFCEHLLPRTGACLAAIEAGAESMMALAVDQF
jgi:hypothetical protein